MEGVVKKIRKDLMPGREDGRDGHAPHNRRAPGGIRRRMASCASVIAVARSSHRRQPHAARVHNEP
jgi:hypothetical protein